jgi:hypothetical protein
LPKPLKPNSRRRTVAHDIVSILIGVGIGLLAVICVRAIDYIFNKLKEKNK